MIHFILLQIISSPKQLEESSKRQNHEYPFLPWPLELECRIIFVLGMLPNDLEFDPCGVTAIRGWLWTCRICSIFCFTGSFSWFKLSSECLFSIMPGDQLTTKKATARVHAEKGRWECASLESSSRWSKCLESSWSMTQACVFVFIHCKLFKREHRAFSF